MHCHKNAKPITKWTIEQSVSNRALDTGHLPTETQLWQPATMIYEKSSYKLLNSRAACSTDAERIPRQTVWLSDRCTHSIRNPNKGEKPSTCLSFSLFRFRQRPQRVRIEAMLLVGALSTVPWSSFWFDSIRVVHTDDEGSPSKEGNNKSYTFPFHSYGYDSNGTEAGCSQIGLNAIGVWCCQVLQWELRWAEAILFWTFDNTSKWNPSRRKSTKKESQSLENKNI